MVKKIGAGVVKKPRAPKKKPPQSAPLAFTSPKDVSYAEAKSSIKLGKLGLIHTDVTTVPDVLPAVRNVYEAIEFTFPGNEAWRSVCEKAIAQTKEAIQRVMIEGAHLIPSPTLPIVPKCLREVRVVLMYLPPREYTSDVPKRWADALEPYLAPNETMGANVNFNRVPGVLFLQIPMYQRMIKCEVTGLDYVCARYIEDLVVHMFETYPKIMWVFMNSGMERYLSNHTQMLSFKDKHTIGFKTEVSSARLLKETDRVLEALENKTAEKERKARKSKIKLKEYRHQLMWKFAIAK